VRKYILKKKTTIPKTHNDYITN